MRTIWLVVIACLLVWSEEARGQDLFGRLTKDAHNPVMSGGGDGTWNKHVFNPTVLYNADSSRYEMWFSAASGPMVNNGHPWQVGFATSSDGVNWTSYPNPVFSPAAGQWDAASITSHAVIRQNGQYKMWYGAWDGGNQPNYIGYATSPDGIHWSRGASNPLFGPGKLSWEVGGVEVGTVLYLGGRTPRYLMWYAGYDAAIERMKIGFATSKNGTDWVRDSLHSPILDSTAGTWDSSGVAQPIVVEDGQTGRFYMWYTSGATSGAAVSTDGVSGWSKYSGNPVLPLSPGGWDHSGATVCSVVIEDTIAHFWYDGWRSPTDSYPLRIGHATLTISDVAEDVKGMPTAFGLSQNYPNPFNPTTVISCLLPVASHARIVVYDILGREVAVLIDEKKGAGRYEVTFDGAGLSSGVYVYRLMAGDHVESKTMLLLK